MLYWNQLEKVKYPKTVLTVSTVHVVMYVLSYVPPLYMRL